MKLPISIFPNVTEYTRANWTGYLKPAQVKLDSYSIVEEAKKVTTITQRPDGVIVIKKKANNAWGSGDYNIVGTTITISNIPANSAIVVVHELIADAPDWTQPWTKESGTDEFAGNPKTKLLSTSADGKHELVKVCGSKTAVSGTITLSIKYGYEGYHTVYFAFYDADRLDACLTGNHLKSISVGDKLGLVYWDGTYFDTDGAHLTRVSGSDDWAYIYATDVWDDTGCLGLVREGAGVTKALLAKPGTINLSDYGISLAKSTSLITGNHLMHVI